MAWPSTDVTSFAAIQLQYGALDGDPECRNTFHVWGHDDSNGIGADAAAQLEVLNSDWISELVALYGAVMPDDYAFTGVLMRGIPDPNDDSYVPAEAFVSFDREGDAGAADHASALACLLHISTDVARKGGSGRISLSAAASGWDQINGHWNTSGSPFSDAQAIATKLRTLTYVAGPDHAGEEMADLDLVVWSLARMKRSEEPWAARATDVRARTKIHWLRSRMPHG